jgi:hypothetical protein
MSKHENDAYNTFREYEQEHIAVRKDMRRLKAERLVTAGK